MEKLRQQGLYVPGRRFILPFQPDEPVSYQGMMTSEPNTEVLEEAKQRILFELIATNLGILGISGALGYFLAGKTLRPIRTMVDEQNRFITDASHELRTPLTSLKSEIEVNLRDKKLTLPQAKKLIESNLEEVNNLQYLSDNLIKLAQNHNPNSVHFESVSLSEIGKSALNKVEKLAKKKNITLKSTLIDQELPGDRQGLTELLVILLDNAIKYSPENKSVNLSIKINGRFAVIEVTDEGVGINKNDVDKLFERFYRADRSRNQEGYGLGLSIAKQIVQKHKGSIDVKSELNRGTTFTIKLPINH
jgi:signal transduction histidine kinase